MRFIGLIGGVLILAGCATTTPETVKSAGIADEPTTELAPGQCGLFGWSTDETRSFIFYADEKTARYAQQNIAPPQEKLSRSVWARVKPWSAECVTRAPELSH